MSTRARQSWATSALDPVGDLPTWLAVLNRLNPLTYAVEPMRRMIFDRLDGSAAARHDLATGVTRWGWPVPVPVELAIVLVLGLVMLAIAVVRFAPTE